MVEILKVDFRHIKDLEIISFKELPEENQTLQFEEGNEMTLLRQMAKLIHMSLINPKRWVEFGSLGLEEFLEFFTKWVKISQDKSDEKSN
jgi:hypothetical protein